MTLAKARKNESDTFQSEEKEKMTLVKMKARKKTITKVKATLAK